MEAIGSSSRRPEHEHLISELAALNPSITPETVSKRLSPAQWDALRRRLLRELLAEGDDPDAASHFAANPDKFTPQGVETYRRSRDECDKIIATRDKESWRKDIKDREQTVAGEANHLARHPSSCRVFHDNLVASLEQMKAIYQRLFAPTDEELKSPRYLSWQASVARGKKLLAQPQQDGGPPPHWLPHGSDPINFPVNFGGDYDHD
jgi:hypothetical protein